MRVSTIATIAFAALASAWPSLDKRGNQQQCVCPACDCTPYSTTEYNTVYVTKTVTQTSSVSYCPVSVAAITTTQICSYCTPVVVTESTQKVTSIDVTYSQYYTVCPTPGVYYPVYYTKPVTITKTQETFYYKVPCPTYYVVPYNQFICQDCEKQVDVYIFVSVQIKVSVKINISVSAGSTTTVTLSEKPTSITTVPISTKTTSLTFSPTHTCTGNGTWGYC